MRMLISLLVLVAGLASCGVGIHQGLADGSCVNTGNGFACDGNPLTFAGAFGVAVAFWLYGSAARAARRRTTQDFRRRGRDAPATVLSVGDTGMTRAQDPIVQLRLRVEPSGGPAAYEADLRTVVSRLNIPRPGDQVAVRYLPEDPSKVALADGASFTAPASRTG